MPGYALHISTRGLDRWKILHQWLPRLAWQSEPPALVVIVNNNDDPDRTGADFNLFGVQVLAGCGKRNDADGSAIALGRISDSHHKIAVKWDDDLVPTTPDCLARLVNLVRGGFAAAGGMYPRFMAPTASGMEEGDYPESGDLDPRHLQFFDWATPHTVVRRRHLYSSFAYDVNLAVGAGGFCTDYSRLAYRHETDFTLRLDHARPGLAVDTAALAHHLVAPGGVREIGPEDYRRMAAEDATLFDRRMRELGIDPNL